jgi:hypothetical protein
MLDQIKIASPCTADWDRMEGTDRVRFCSECQKNVFNLSAMTRREAEALLQETNGTLCTQLYRRADGTVLTTDCQVGLRAKVSRVQRRLSWSVAGALGFAAAAFGQSPAVLSGKVTYDGSHPVGGVAIVVTDLTTKKSINTTADNEGTFRVPSLESGEYKVQATSPGFQQFTDDHVKLPASGEIRLKIVLALGTVGGQAAAVALEPIPSRSKLDPLP